MEKTIFNIILAFVGTGVVLFLIGFIYGLYLVFKKGVDWPPEEK